jgi:16S rRNA C967 or C1407 C5-methylase (RsmB/RsmF family)
MLSNIKKLKVDNIKTIKIDALKIIDKYKQNSFNKVLIDAPCS